MFDILHKLAIMKHMGKIVDFSYTVDAANGKVDIWVTPAKPIEYIKLDFVAVRSNVSFEEVVGTLTSE